jgi:hypothetical protein
MYKSDWLQTYYYDAIRDLDRELRQPMLMNTHFRWFVFFFHFFVVKCRDWEWEWAHRIFWAQENFSLNKTKDFDTFFLAVFYEHFELIKICANRLSSIET